MHYHNLFLLDIYASTLELTENAYEDSGGEKLVVRVNFTDFPPLEVNEFNRNITEELFEYQFDRGMMYLFSMDPKELIHKMRRMPLNIGLFRLGDSYPICDARIRLSGCACDLVRIVFGIVERSNQLFVSIFSQLVKPEEGVATMTFRGPFHLKDPGKNEAGSLTGEINVTNLGSTHVTRFGLQNGFVTIKNVTDETEYRCYDKLQPPKGITDIVKWNIFGSTTGFRSEVDLVAANYALQIVGVAQAAPRLAYGIPPEPPSRIPLIDPDAVDKEAERRRRREMRKRRKGRKGKKRRRGKKGRRKGRKKK